MPMQSFTDACAYTIETAEMIIMKVLKIFY